MTQDPLHVLVVDDTVTYRKIVGDVLMTMPDVHVIGAAANGKIALQKIEQNAPDLIVLDVEMPEMDGLEVLRRLKASGSSVGAIMLSAFTAQGAQTTLAALELGAFDFALKPSGGIMEENFEKLRKDLAPKIAAFSRTIGVRRALRGQAAPARPAPARPAQAVATPSAPARSRSLARTEVVTIGISTGGPKALTEMMPRLGAGFPVPILIVQHMPPVFTKSLADDLNTKCKIRVIEAFDGQPILPGTAFIAPGGKQMRIRRDAARVLAQITDDPPENSCKPSVDYLFRSVADVYGEHTLGVIMTGMGNDGSAGCRVIKRGGGAIVAQDEASCVVFGMPREPVEQGIADSVVSLDRIAAEITQFVEKGRLSCK
jgi:two-component system, chemotaxis family, protein-glutamate methylesterase/glutaminase